MVNETPKLNSPELRKLRRLLIGSLFVNFLNYVAILISSWIIDLYIPFFSIPIIAVYYILEGSLFFGRQAYNWPCTLTFRVIWVLHDLAYYITFALSAAFDVMDGYTDIFYVRISLALALFFLFTFGLGIGIIVAFSKFPRLGCCHQTIVQNFVVSGQTYPMQLTQQMPNGQLVVVQNPNSEIYNPVAAQTVQNTTQTQSTIVQQVANQPAVVQPVQQQNDLPPSYDKILER